MLTLLTQPYININITTTPEVEQSYLTYMSVLVKRFPESCPRTNLFSTYLHRNIVCCQTAEKCQHARAPPQFSPSDPLTEKYYRNRMS